MNLVRRIAWALIASPALAQTSAEPVRVTPDNFNRAESDINLGFVVKDGAFGKFKHLRELYPIDAPIVRPNRDTLYSMSVFDLDAGPVTITLPDAGKRFMSMQVINEDQYTMFVAYGAGKHTLTREKIGCAWNSHPGESSGCGGHERGSCPAGCHQGRTTGRPRKLRGAELGHDQSQEGARRIAGAE
jgi:hypothetical protein